jgi:hypothetical protein
MRQKFQYEKLVEITKEEPGVHSVRSLSIQFKVHNSTIWRYVRELNLPVKMPLEYTEEQKEFVLNNASTMTKAEICRASGLQYHQVANIAKMAGIEFFERVRVREESEFFEHDPYYSY